MNVIIPIKQMQKIAEEVGTAIHRDVNIMDETGRIIASTDKKRIGMPHAGAEVLLEKHLDELVIEKGYKGTCHGVNLPLVIENQVIGVVGITGPVEEVRMLGGVIRKMTEILIMDRYKSSQKQALEELRRGFVLDILFGEDENRMEVGTEMFKIDIRHPRVVSVLELELKQSEQEEEWQETTERIFSRIKKEAEKENQQVTAQIGAKIIIFHNTDDTEEAKDKIVGMIKKTKEGEACRISGGIGSARSDKAGIQRSYREADLACSIARKQKGSQVRVYSGTDLSLLLMDISYNKRKAFVDEMFRNCDQNQKKQIIQCLKSYIKNNGSISKVSEELFIHKNTLQYRLAKMKTLTGYDPRVLSEAVLLAMAVYLEELLE